jgi:hypothetical protein
MIHQLWWEGAGYKVFERRYSIQILTTRILWKKSGIEDHVLAMNGDNSLQNLGFASMKSKGLGSDVIE